MLTSHYRIIISALAVPAVIIMVFPIVLAALPFIAVAFMTSLLTRLLEAKAVSWNELIDFCPEIGWTMRPNLKAWCRAEPAGDVFRLSTDEQGWRGSQRLQESDIVVFGDSFAFGYGVNEDAWFAGRQSGVRIKPVGAPGYSMVQEVLLMRRLATCLNRKLVVWFIYTGNDLYDNLRPHNAQYRSPFVRPSKSGDQCWEIVTHHLSPAYWPYSQEQLLRDHREMLGSIYCRNCLSERAFSACRFLITQARRACASCLRLVVVTVPDVFELSEERRGRLLQYSLSPDTFDPDLPDQEIARHCSELNVPFVSGKAYWKAWHYNEGDRHWNRAGHSVALELLLDVHRKTLRLSPQALSCRQDRLAITSRRQAEKL